jgi:nickel transport protein
MRTLTLTLALATALVICGQAHAHKVVASVHASGDVIEGEIGFSNGGMAAYALIEVFDEGGAKLGETKTDAEGFFTYRPTARVVHVFRANLGAGHVAEARMAVDDLPNVAGAETAPVAAETPTIPDATERPETIGAADLGAGQRRMIADLIRQEMNPLRREIAAYRNENDLQAILGGIGYILGLFGIGFYLAARRKLRGA